MSNCGLAIKFFSTDHEGKQFVGAKSAQFPLCFLTGYFRSTHE